MEEQTEKKKRKVSSEFKIVGTKLHESKVNEFYKLCAEENKLPSEKIRELIFEYIEKRKKENKLEPEVKETEYGW